MALKILLADDSMTAQNMGKKILMEAGYEVVAVSNGAAAVKKIAEQKPDVVVLDVYMPGYTGLEVCERVKSAIETTKIPVLLTVGKMEPFKPEEGARVKADGVIVKPFEASDLLAAVQKLEQRLNSPNSAKPGPPGPARVMVTPGQPPADEPPEYERTQKLKTPVFDQDKDESLQAWKSATAEPTEPAYPPTQALPVTPTELPEEDFPSAAAEPHAVNVPTELRAAPAMGMEHLENESNPEGERTTTELLERNTEYLERSTSELNPYQIMEEGVDDSAPKSGVGRFFSKAKSWFGGASALEGIEEQEAAAGQDAGEAETITLSPVAISEPVQAPLPVPGAHEAVSTTSEGSAHDIDMESAVEAHAASKADIAQHPDVSDLHLSAVVSSWEPPKPAPTSAMGAANSEPMLEVAPSPSSSYVPSGTVPDLEITSQRSTGDVPAGAASDSLLVTDVNEMSAQFPTRFGVKDAETVPVGTASDYPELYGNAGADQNASIEDTQEIDTPAELREPQTAHTQDFEAQVSSAMGSNWSEDAAAQADAGLPHTHEAPLSGWSAEETQLEANEIGANLHEEMKQQFSTGQTVEHELPASPGIAGTTAENGPDAQLAAAMAAAMGTEVTPALTEAVHQAFTGDATMALDKHTAVIAEIVHRVTERMKPELVAEIARELALEVKKGKKIE